MPLAGITDSFELDVGERATTNELRVEMWAVGDGRWDNGSHCCAFDKRRRMLGTACKTGGKVRNKIVVCRVAFVLDGCWLGVLLCGERWYWGGIIRDVTDQFNWLGLGGKIQREFVVSGEREYFQKSG